jgi:hypothetical protein
MNAPEILRIAEQQGVTIKAHGEVIRFKPKDLPPLVSNLIQSHKTVLLDYLTNPSTASNTAPDLQPNDSRALHAFIGLMNRHRQTLIKGGYSPDQARIKRRKWREAVIKRLGIYQDAMDEIEGVLIGQGLLKICMHNIHIEASDGIPIQANR